MSGLKITSGPGRYAKVYKIIDEQGAGTRILVIPKDGDAGEGKFKANVSMAVKSYYRGKGMDRRVQVFGQPNGRDVLITVLSKPKGKHDPRDQSAKEKNLLPVKKVQV